MNIFLENWYLFVAVIVVIVAIISFVYKFLTLPTKEQEAKVKQWLLWAVTQAESELGGGTGQLKLRQVYDLFIQRFPALAKMVSFETFSLWVDEALVEMKGMLDSNKKIAKLVKGA